MSLGTGAIFLNYFRCKLSIFPLGTLLKGKNQSKLCLPFYYCNSDELTFE